MLAGFRSMLHASSRLLLALQDPHLVKERCYTLVQKNGRIPQVAAHSGLRNGYNPHAQGFQLCPKLKPQNHVAEHPALIVDHHGISSTGFQKAHHAIILRPCLLHAGNGVVCKNIQDAQPVLLAPFAAFFNLHFNAGLVLIRGGIPCQYVSAVFHMSSPILPQNRIPTV